MKMQSLMLVIVITLAVSVGLSVERTPPPAAAQDPTAACNAVVGEALALIAANCLGIGNNEVCYANAGIEATLNDDTYFFDRAGDVVPVTALDTLQTLPANLETGEWGVAVMDVTADLPAGQTVRMVMMGGVEVEPTVVATAPGPTCTFTATGDEPLNMRARPTTEAAALDQLAPGERVQIDGRTEDGGWFHSSRGWFVAGPGDVVCEAGPVDAVANPADVHDAPMQAFNMSVSGNGDCNATPAGVVIQVPSGETGSLVVNGVTLRVGSTTFLTQDTADESVRVVNLDGTISATDDNNRTAITLTGDETVVQNNATDDPAVTAFFDTAQTIDLELVNAVVPEPIRRFCQVDTSGERIEVTVINWLFEGIDLLWYDFNNNCAVSVLAAFEGRQLRPIFAWEGMQLFARDEGNELVNVRVSDGDIVNIGSPD